ARARLAVHRDRGCETAGRLSRRRRVRRSPADRALRYWAAFAAATRAESLTRDRASRNTAATVRHHARKISRLPPASRSNRRRLLDNGLGRAEENSRRAAR